MDKYQAAIVEYEAARKQIIQLGDDIGKSIGSFDHGHYIQSCTCGIESDNPLDDTDCFRLLYKWRKAAREYDKWNNSRYPYEECGDEPDLPCGEEPPKLCEAGKITDKLIQDRKSARKRFGIAKRRLSALAKPFANQKTHDV